MFLINLIKILFNKEKILFSILLLIYYTRNNKKKTSLNDI